MLLRPFTFNDKIISVFGDRSFEYDKVLEKGTIELDGIKISMKQLYFSEQIHSDGIAVIPDNLSDNSQENRPSIIPNVDALISGEPGLFLAVKYADCIPILLYDPVKKAVAGIHSGRAGTEKNIAGKTVDKMKETKQTDPSELLAALGPSICAEHYEVSEEVFQRFVSETEIEQSFPLLDLKKVVQGQLLASGVKKENIEDHSYCTYENRNYHSYRRDNTTKRQISLIGMIHG